MASVIRRENFSSTAPFSFRDIESEAARILQRARCEADLILASARDRALHEAEALRERTKQKGLAAGHAEGLAVAQQAAARTALDDARQRLDALATTLADAAEQLDGNKHRLMAAAETGLIHLAIAIARRVCKTDLGAASDVARRNAQQLLEYVSDAHDPVLHVHPEDHEALQAALPQLVSRLRQIDHVEIVSDQTVGRGGCVLHTHEGLVDGTLDAQLDNIATALIADAGGRDE